MTKLISKKNRQITILMCTYNGEKFLNDQLESFITQTYSDWHLIVSDDGSTDKTLEILKAFKRRVGPSRITIRQGPHKGFCQNFLSLITDPKIHGDYFALSDQDDIWYTNKLELLIKGLVSHNAKIPYLSCGRTHYVSKDLQPLGNSDLFRYPPSFRNAIVQSIAGGNTMAFNRALKSLAEWMGPADVVSHDWWLYILCEAVGGVTQYYHHPMIDYRQHAESLIGSNVGLMAKLKRLRLLLLGSFKQWNDQHILALKKLRPRMTPKAKRTLDRFEMMRDQSWMERVRMIKYLGLYRQTLDGMVALYLGAIINKL